MIEWIYIIYINMPTSRYASRFLVLQTHVKENKDTLNNFSHHFIFYFINTFSVPNTVLNTMAKGQVYTRHDKYTPGTTVISEGPGSTEGTRVSRNQGKGHYERVMREVRTTSDSQNRAVCWSLGEDALSREKKNTARRENDAEAGRQVWRSRAADRRVKS